tara:strand:- start:109 stop:465 length:357 start_codon:yes stop_codon:yes gene_type:complete
MNKKLTTYNKGVWAERVCCFILWFKGYRILETRYKTKLGEVDIIARSKKEVLFVEVKYRKGKEQAAYSISQKSQNRIANAAKLYLQSNPDLMGLDMRFDAFLLSGYFYPKHIENAWLV